MKFNINSRNNLGLLSPGWLMLVFMGSGVLLPIWPFMQGLDGFSLFWKFDFLDKKNAIEIALALYFSGFVAFIFGVYLSYIFFQRSIFSDIRKIQHCKPNYLRYCIIILTGVSATIITIVMVGGVDAWILAGSDRIRQYAGLSFLLIPQNALLSVSVSWFLTLNPKKGGGKVGISREFICYTVLALFIVAIQGAKSTLYVFFFSMLVIWHVRVRRLKFFRLSIIGLTAYVVLIIYHLIKQEYLVVGEFVSLNGEGGLAQNFFRVLFEQLTGNLMQLQTMAVLTESIPNQLPYSLGATLEMLWLIWVPSSLYPDKPLTAPGVFTSAIWPDKWEMEGTTMPPGIFGEFYMNFGWSGIIGGGLFLGLIYGYVYNRFRDKDSDINLGLYALFAAMMLHYLRGELASPTVLLVSMAAPLVWILRGSRKSIRVSR